MEKTIDVAGEVLKDIALSMKVLMKVYLLQLIRKNSLITGIIDTVRGDRPRKKMPNIRG